MRTRRERWLNRVPPTIYQCEQNTAEWMYLRVGLPTASNVAKILTPGGKISAQAEDYMFKILAEIIVGHPIEAPETEWMRRGSEEEFNAVQNYEFQNDVETERCGFMVSPDGVGASPDRLVGSNGLLQIKIPTPHVHTRYLINGELEDSYKPQLQTELLVSEREWVDAVSWHPEMPTVQMRVGRDEAYIKLLSVALGTFNEKLRGAIATLIERGLIKPNWKELMKPPASEPDDSAKDAISEEDLNRILEAQRVAREITETESK